MSTATRAKLGKLALSLAGGLLALLACELFLRLRSAHVVPAAGAMVESHADLLIRQTARGKRLVPNARVVVRNHHLSHQDVAIETDSLGLRDAELARPKPAGELRVLVLGDSITFGDYLPAGEVYVERAEQRLRALLPGRSLQVVNAGVGDVGLREEVDLLEEIVEPVEPDVVVVAFYLNDSRPPWGFPAEMGHPNWLRRHSVLAGWLYREAVLRRFLRLRGADRFAWYAAMRQQDWVADPAAFARLAAAARYDWGAAWEPQAWTAVGEQLDRLASLAERRSFAVAVASFPVYFQVYARDVHDEPQRRLEREAAGRGFAFLDLLPMLRQQNRTKLFFDQCHPTAAVNARIGSELAGFLIHTYRWSQPAS